MDHAAVLAAYDRQLRHDTTGEGGDTRVERTGDVVRVTGSAHDWNGVLWADVDTSTADAVIAEQVRHYTAAGREFEWKQHSYDRPADLGERLLAAGFEAEPAETLMVAEAAALPAGPELADGVRLVPVTDAEGVRLMSEAHLAAFGEGDAALSERLARRVLAQLAETPDDIVAVVAMAGDRPVCGARMEFCPGTDFAGLWGGGTDPLWRGKGIYRATVAYRARIAVERGYRYLQVDATDDSRPILDRLGFTTLCTTTPYVYRP
ncbi:MULTISPECIES: GNAT family N-acetyltransferase [unclassified Streptomyces]|uniref:GNAT family N-acetyltransferase n=1 Tax=unclassified Streptomyces TaxID=2593676 RepID=UPI001367C9D6|nr:MULTISPECIES: GNAT family N-acetyltransferase [unclassified Streptomyces]NDZ99285.1 GNAT family N-acetyltransferase [Streptomyces sp. SID10116]MYY85238.1 GNAT family N-acetyltransferase [Streptomyces sp. SID335]MYZ16080.1 GNAT family N-acetyltransferase [Streptomyces sp. SID337]NDZ91159.1 GNAT family N-acetyltransferase [Streptomyces sp. SID10115]NEB47756.1 GNAT family N-acetyltransferase [Streptomyces sp. SID339]